MGAGGSPRVAFAALRVCSADYGVSRDWFERLFERAPVEDSAGFAAFEIAGTRLELIAADAKNPASAGGSIGYWRVENLATWVERAVRLGGEVYRGPMWVAELG
jgi:predicted enzyme related to lactoylglutathione lyase